MIGFIKLLREIKDNLFTVADHLAIGDAAPHHAEAHTIVSHTDTSATGPELDELVGGGVTALHSHAGGSTTFTELAGTDKTTADAQGLGDGVWGDWDISGIVPEGTDKVLVGCYKVGAIDFMGVRKGGTALARTFELESPTTAFIITEVSATRTIGIMSNDVSDLDEFRIYGYWS